MNRSTGILLSLCALFFGVILGFSLAPIKRGAHVHIVAGNTNLPVDPSIQDQDVDEEDLSF